MFEISILIVSLLWVGGFKAFDPTQANFLSALIGAVAGPVVGGILGSRAQKKADEQTQAANATRIQTTVADAKAAGINPLTAINSGAAMGWQQPSQANLASYSAIGGAITDAFDVITKNQSEKTAQKQKATTDAARKIEKTDAGGVGNVVNRTARLTQAANGGVNIPVADPPTLTARPPRLSFNIATDQGVVPLPETSNPTPTRPDGSIDTTDDGGTGTTLNPRKRFVDASGDTMDVTLGPEIDELITGGAIDAVMANRRRVDDNRMEDLTAEYYTKDIDQRDPITWDDAFGKRKPKRWASWTNKEKIAYIRRAMK